MLGMTDHPTHAYEALTPDVMLDALASTGLVGDGRLMALSSYENRVVQCHLDEAPDGVESPVVAKFYRPNRWSDEAIEEEHAFAWELADADVVLLQEMDEPGTKLIAEQLNVGYAFAEVKPIPEIDREKRTVIIRDRKPWCLVEVKQSASDLSPALKFFQDRTKAPHAFQVELDAPYVDVDCFAHPGRPLRVPARTFLSQLI